jgi:hypothetical protein
VLDQKIRCSQWIPETVKDQNIERLVWISHRFNVDTVVLIGVRFVSGRVSLGTRRNWFVDELAEPQLQA